MIELRSALEVDAEFIQDAYRDNLEQKTTRSAIENSIHSAKDFVYVASIKGQRCGFAHAVWSGGPYELLGIGVTDQTRRQGVGLCLLQALISSVEKAGGEALWLEVRADNRAAHQLYIKTGAVHTGSRKAYYSDGVDAVLMSYCFASES